FERPACVRPGQRRKRQEATRLSYLEDMMNRRHLLMSAAALCALMAFSSGCNQGKDTKAKPEQNAGSQKGKVDKDDHSNGMGPHKGAVGHWGTKYHIEFTVDHGTKEATVYILGSDEKSPAPIKAKNDELLLTIEQPSFQIPLKASPQKGDPEGKASRFVA